MATLTQYLALRDGVSGPLKKMTQAAETLQRQETKTAAAAQRMESSLGRIGRAAAQSAPGLESLASIGSSALRRLQSAGSGAMRSIQNLKESMNKALGGTVGQFALGNIIGSVALRGVDAAKEQLVGLVKTADEFSGIQARLNLVTGSQEKAVELNEAIYQSALRARGAYSTMADSVSKIGLTAKDAFPDPKELVPFVENVQKLFAIGGTGAVEQKNAMLQLTQALGSGRLQGDELRSIAEAAPMLEQVIAEYMGVSVGEIKQLGAEGQITAEIIKNAMLNATDEINRKFDQIPLKWDDIWTNIATRTTWAFRPVYDQLTAIANSKGVQTMANGIVTGMTMAAQVLNGVISIAMVLGDAIYNVGSYIGEWLTAGVQAAAAVLEVLATIGIGAFTGLAVSAMMYGTYLLITNAQLIIFEAQQLAAAAASAVMSAAMRVTALAASLASIKVALLGAVTWALANPILFVIGLIGAVVAAFTMWQVGTEGLRETIASAFSSIAGIVADCVNFVIDKINVFIRALNKAAETVNGVFHTNIGMVGEIEFRADSEGWSKSAGDFVRALSLDSFMPDMANKSGVTVGGGYGSIPSMDDMAGSMKDAAGGARDTADNTKAMLDAMDIMDEDLKFFRDIAEQEVINKYTTASIDIKVENNNNISNGVDADGMIVHLIDQLGEAMDAGAEAVHP